MATAKFNLDKRSLKKDGTYPVKIYITHISTFRIGTQFSASEDKWNGDKFSTKEPNYKVKNFALQKLMSKVEYLLMTLEENGKLKGTTDKQLSDFIKTEISNKPQKAKFFPDYIDEYIETIQKENTKGVYEGTKAKLLSYDPTCTFNTMDKKWLTEFNRWMENSGLSTNTRSIHLRNIRTIFNYAIDNGKTELYPFRRFSIESEETRKRNLKIEEVVMLRNCRCEEYQKEYRDMFMLMIYLIGINGIDLFHIKNIKNGRIEYNREKTGKFYSIKVEPEAMDIINKYKGKEYLLRQIEKNNGNYRNYMVAMNRGLGRIGKYERKGLGGKKQGTPLFPNLTSYWARHTWATIAHKIGISKDDISLALGHEFGSKTTQIYIEFDLEKVDEANRKVINAIHETENWIKLKGILDALYHTIYTILR